MLTHVFNMWRLQAGMTDYRKFEEGRDAGDFSTLPELHASLSGLKVRPLEPGNEVF